MSTLITWQDETGALGVIRLDIATSATPEDSMTITEHPVEQGANVVDHAREEPTRFTLEGMVSSLPNPEVDTDTAYQSFELTVPVMNAAPNQTIKLQPPEPPIQLSPSGLIQAGVGAIVNAVTGGPNMNAEFAGVPRPGSVTLQGQGLQQTAPRNRIRDVYEALLRVMTARQLVTVNTRDRDLFDMMIERVAEPRAVEDGSSAKFQVDLKRIRVTASKTVQAPKPTEARGKGPVNKGAQATKKKTDPKPFKSVAAALADAGVDLIHLGG